MRMKKIITILLLIGALAACKNRGIIFHPSDHETRYPPTNDSPLYRFYPNLSIQHDSNSFVEIK